MTDPRPLLKSLFDRPDRNEWTDSVAALVLEEVLSDLLDFLELCDEMDVNTNTETIRHKIAKSLEVRKEL